MNLKTKRQKVGLTMQSLAEKLKCNKQQVWNWENGRAFPPMKHAAKYAALLKVPVSEMVSLIVKMNTAQLMKRVKQK
jgi:transcriptional regulator with XRE-family HTH domain